MKTIDLTLLIPEKDEITSCYKMGLKSLNINEIVLPIFAIRIDKKDIFLERLKDEFGSDFKIEDLSKEQSDIVNVRIYHNFLKG